MFRTWSHIALITAVSLYPGYISSVHAVSLSSLTNSNGTIQQGDKLFSNFSFDPIVGNCLLNPCGPASAGTIDVQGIAVAGQNGLRFTGPFFEISIPTQQVFTFYQIQYDVTVTNPAFLLHDLHQSFSGSSTGTSFATAQTRTTVQGMACLNGNAPGDICDTAGGGGANGKNFSSDVTGLLPSDVSTAHVIEGFSFGPIIGSGGDPTGSVSVTSFDITFSQAPVPEASAWLLLGSGLVGIVFWRGRQLFGKFRS